MSDRTQSHTLLSSRGLRYHALSCHWDSSSPRWLFLHGFLGCAQDWHSFIQHLPEGTGWAALDLLGHGQSNHPQQPQDYSPALIYEDLRQIWPQLGISNQDIVVGYSMGGRQLLGSLLTHDLSAGALILIGASFGIADPQTRMQRLQQDQQKAAQINPNDLTLFLDAWYQQPMLARQVPSDPQEYQNWHQRRMRNQPRAIAACLEGFSPGHTPDFAPQVHRLTLPTLLLSGSEDPAYSDHYKQIVEHLPQGCHVIVSGCGHTPQMESPLSTSQQCLSFLKSHHR